MNVSSLFDIVGSMRRYAMFSQRPGTVSGASSFANKLSAAQQNTNTHIQGDSFTLRMGENILSSGWHSGQSYTAEYTEDSTNEDPIVRISGTASSGAFDFTSHIRDIDPSNASYVELRALYSYLCRTGEYQPQHGGMSSPLPVGMECGDISRKQDYIKSLKNFIASASQNGVYPKFGPNIYAHARELLELYQTIAPQSGPRESDVRPSSRGSL